MTAQRTAAPARGRLLAVLGLVVASVFPATGFAADATMTLSTNAGPFHAGDLHVPSLALNSPGSLTVDVYVVGQAPSGDIFSLVGVNQVAIGLAPLASGVTLPASFTFPSQPIFSLTLPALPVGTYKWFGALTLPGTLTLVSNLAEIDWVFENPSPPGPTYIVEDRNIESGGVTRAFVLARPSTGSAGLPVMILLHGDGGNGASARGGFDPIESDLLAVYAYPDAVGGTFPYDTAAGRTSEAQFIQDLIAALAGELGINTGRIFLGGISGGATMSNALGCYLGPGIIRGLAINSGSLYDTENDISYAPDGGVFCPPGTNTEQLPAAIIVWGKDDTGGGTTYDPDGLGTRDLHLRTQGCEGAPTTPGPHPPCVIYDGCTRTVTWCAIDGMGHQIWSDSHDAFATFFDSLH